MPTKLMLALLSLSLFFTAPSFALSASSTQDQKGKKILENSDVVKMAQIHFDDETLLTVIDVNDTNFDISPSALIDLKTAGISDRVIRAMLQATQKKQSAVPPSAPSSAPPSAAVAPVNTVAPNDPASSSTSMSAIPGMTPAMQSQLSSLGGMGMGNMGGMFSAIPPEQMPHVYLMSEPSKEEIPASTAQIAQTKFNSGAPSQGGMMLRSLSSMALSFASIGAGPGGIMAMSAFSMGSRFMSSSHKGPSMTYVWGLPGLHSSRGLNTASPMFQFRFGDIPGVDPDEYEPALVRLVQTKDNYRLVGATQSKIGNMIGMGGGGESKWVSEDRWPVRLDREERGVYVLHVEKPLDPGEYAVVLHPLKGQTAKPSTFGGMGGGMGMGGFGAGPQLFYSAWDFTVPGTPPDNPGKKKK